MTVSTTIPDGSDQLNAERRVTVHDVVSIGKRRLATNALICLVVALTGLGAPYMLSLYWLEIAVQGATLGILALSVGWLLRQSGLLSFGHAAYYGAAGYAMGIIAERSDLSASLVMVLGVLCGTLLSIVVALLIARSTGISFAMLSLAVGMLVWVATTRSRDWTNGVDGLVVRLEGSVLGSPAAEYTSPVTSWPLVWLTLILSIAGLWALSRTPFGRMIAAIRENEERVRFAGVSTYLPRVAVVAVSGLLASISGSLSALHHGFVSPENVFWTMSGAALIVAIIGGVGSVWGPPIGAIAYTVLQASLAETSFHQAIVGAVLIVVVVLAPGGIAEIVSRVASKLRGRSSHA